VILNVLNNCAGSRYTAPFYILYYIKANMSFALSNIVIGSGSGTAIKDSGTALSSLGGSGVPAGIIADYAGITEPSGWLFCYGQAISRTTYATLFTAISTNYGVGDNSTTFNLPDCRGRVSAGKDNMGGTSADRLTGQTGGLNGDTMAATGGTETHTLDISQMPSHSHNCALAGSTSFGTNFQGGNQNAGQNAQTSNTGSGLAHNNIQPTIIVTKIIKT
jgi:microcystin-dependent protein